MFLRTGLWLPYLAKLEWEKYFFPSVCVQTLKWFLLSLTSWFEPTTFGQLWFCMYHCPFSSMCHSEMPVKILCSSTLEMSSTVARISSFEAPPSSLRTWCKLALLHWLPVWADCVGNFWIDHFCDGHGGTNTVWICEMFGLAPEF